MKRRFTLIMLVLTSITAQASLEADMKAISASVKKIAAQAHDVNLKANNLNQVVNIRKAIARSIEEIPESITENTEMNDDQKFEAGVHYRQMMIDLLASTPILELAIAKGDGAAVLVELKNMDDKKKKGHLEFK